jgi:hypothetical protein
VSQNSTYYIFYISLECICKKDASLLFYHRQPPPPKRYENAIIGRKCRAKHKPLLVIICGWVDKRLLSPTITKLFPSSPCVNLRINYCNHVGTTYFVHGAKGTANCDSSSVRVTGYRHVVVVVVVRALSFTNAYHSQLNFLLCPTQHIRRLQRLRLRVVSQHFKKPWRLKFQKNKRNWRSSKRSMARTCTWIVCCCLFIRFTVNLPRAPKVDSHGLVHQFVFVLYFVLSCTLSASL